MDVRDPVRRQFEVNGAAGSGTGAAVSAEPYEAVDAAPDAFDKDSEEVASHVSFLHKQMHEAEGVMGKFEGSMRKRLAQAYRDHDENAIAKLKQLKSLPETWLSHAQYALDRYNGYEGLQAELLPPAEREYLQAFQENFILQAQIGGFKKTGGAGELLRLCNDDSFSTANLVKLIDGLDLEASTNRTQFFKPYGEFIDKNFSKYFVKNMDEEALRNEMAHLHARAEEFGISINVDDANKSRWSPTSWLNLDAYGAGKAEGDAVLSRYVSIANYFDRENTKKKAAKA